ncbi:hypothetical protein CYMTET_48494 [Cymbomonas tetramitiformis]|uniref:Uncharacterized protein n=1 Tax=Cymbomonas tetramitiformis TaxID=36881 RepID=A0AAE0BTS7_9CHLO|nr:hypothetical protein CYMTET_48494 [Cymbomonas tetramitiformis]
MGGGSASADGTSAGDGHCDFCRWRNDIRHRRSRRKWGCIIGPTVVSAPAAAVDPAVIAAAIATALGGRLDALGNHIAHLETRGAAPAGASLLGGGVAPPEAELLAWALRDSIATVESWDVARCSQACADLVHEAAKLRPQLTLLKEIHPFGKLPMKALARVGEFQLFVKSKPVQRLQQEDEGRIKWKDGDLTVVPKSKKCKEMAEWERGFLRIMCEAPAEARKDLVDFLEWAESIAADCTFYHFSEFYEHLIRQVQRSTIGISPDGYDRVWRVYQQQHRLQPGAKRKRSDYRWSREDGAQQQQQQLPPASNAVPPEEPESSQEAPAGAEEVPVLIPGPAMEVDIAPVVETEIEGEVTLVEHAGVELESAVPTDGLESERWWADLREDEFIPTSPDTWRSPEEPGRVRTSTRWPTLREEILQRAKIENMERRESEEGHIYLARWRLPLGIITLGMVEKLLEFLGVLLSTEGDVCTTSIDEERIAVVVKQAGELRARAAWGMVSRRALESLLGLLAFCSHVVWGLSLYTRRGFNFLAATMGRKMVRLPHQVLEDLAVLEQVELQRETERYRAEALAPETRRCYGTGDLGQESLWAAILVGFFGLFRKDNLTTGKAEAAAALL